MARSRSAASLGELLPKVLKDLKANPRPSWEAIQEAWARVAGKEAARHSWPRSLLKGRLMVEVDSSGWIYTLNLKRSQILQGLIERFGAGRVKGLSLRIGERMNAQQS